MEPLNKDTSLTFDGNQQPGGTNYFQTSSTIPIDEFLAATDNGEGPGSNQPACWAIASGNKAGTPNTSQNLVFLRAFVGPFTTFFNLVKSNPRGNFLYTMIF